MNNGLRDPAIVSFVFTPLLVTSAILLALWWKRMHSSRAGLDAPGLLLASAVRAIPERRIDWGAAMSAELAQVHGWLARWLFALGCMRVALFPPPSPALLQTAGRNPVFGMFVLGCTRVAVFPPRKLSLIGGIMSVYLRKLRGVTGISLIWAPVYAAMFIVLAGIAAIFIPIRGDVGPVRMLAIITQVGFISGSLFGVLLSFAENGKAIRHLSLGRAALWGVLSSAVFPILTGRADQVFWTCPFGAIVALTLVALARQAARREANQSRRNLFLACALLPVRDAVSPAKESAT